MSRNTVTITDTSLSVEPHGLDKIWSFTSRLEFPLAHVRGATHDPGLRHEPKGWRGPGRSYCAPRGRGSGLEAAPCSTNARESDGCRGVWCRAAAWMKQRLRPGLTLGRDGWRR